tara:strand:+ start:454 stop:1737 length:1284 start_codon:yes stop_codon:yes gene_type:complete
MVKITQNIEAAYEPESAYATAPGSNLYHFGLLDTFDPRQVERNITPVPSLGQSTDAHHAKGPLGVTVPIKVACNGNGWKQLLGKAIGGTEILSDKRANNLTTSVESLAVIAKETGGDYTLVAGVVPNEVTLSADYTTGGYITVEANCTGYYSLDEGDANFDGFLGDDYSGVTWPAAPSADPLLPTDLSVTVGFAAATNKLTVDGPANSSIEIGEQYMRIFDNPTGGLDTSISSDGILDLTAGAEDTMEEVKALIHADANWTCTRGGSDVSSQNLLKGIYSTESSQEIFATTTMAAISNLKTVSLKIANNNVPISGKATGDDSSVKWLLNNAISRGKADVTLDLTMTAENEDFYDKYVAGTTIPLIRLDFGTHGSIALTNGTITSFSRPLSAGGEIVDTLSIKFRGAGNYKNFSAYAISSSISLNPSG